MDVRKWNYPNRKWNNFSLFQSSDEKTSFTKVSPFSAMIPNWFSETGKGIILNRKWNYFSPFQLSDQKTSFTKVIPFGSLIPKWLL